MAKILNEKIFKTRLANGLQVEVIDNSKLMAADRWYITLTCHSEIDLPAHKLAKLDLEASLLEKFMAKMDGKISHVCTKERNFVDADFKEEVVAELLAQLQETTLPYLGVAAFVDRLFQQNVDDFVQEYQVRQELGLALDDNDDEDDDGPADFSACFQDNN